MKKMHALIPAFIAAYSLLAADAYASDARLFVHHKVKDFKVWQKSYDSFAPEQKKAGVFKKSVYQSVDDANDVTVIHDFHDVEKAKAFATSPQLAEKMSASGLVGKPDIWITKTAEKN